jgi:1A family penicillin-binding protein
MRVYSYKTPNYHSDHKQPKRKKDFRFKFSFGKFTWKRFLTWTFRIAALGILFLAALFLYYTHDLPDPNKLLERNVPESTKIYARDGSLLYEIHGEYNRTLVNLDQISKYLQNATVAIEDKDFYKHGGISFTGIARAIVVDIIKGEKVQGGSTITQQFVKNAILTKDKSFDRKIREVFLAITIDSRFSKADILKLYLNEIPYGRNAYGAQAAAQTFFNKNAIDLTLAESAYLAALPQSTTYFNPYGIHRDALENRKNTVLNAMFAQGYITEDQLKEAKDEKVAFAEIDNGIKAPHFVLWVEDYLANKYGEISLEEGGLQVYTTLDPKLQEIAETAVKNGVEKSSVKYGANNAALVAIDPKTGQILAMVGSKDYFAKSEPKGCTPGKNCTFEPNVNVAISQRQPGSSFKPYVYVTAFKKEFGYSPASMLVDVVTNFGTFNGKSYIPHNYNNESYGPVSMRQSLAGSLNIPAVKTLDLVGVEAAVQTAHDLGITSPLANCGLSLVLGGCEVRLLDHVAAYSVIANEGVKNSQTPILKILDKSGKTLEEFKQNPQDVLDPQAAYELISIMTDNNARSYVFGPNSPLILSDRPVAAKTGTTQNWHDGWTLGFTPSLAAGVWSGNNDGTLLKKGADGVLVAAPIWHEFMQKALAGTPLESFKVPDGIQQVVVDSVSGKLPTEASPETKTETFASYSIPTGFDDVHKRIAFDSVTGLPANNLTPPENIIYQTVTVLHSEKRENPNWEQPVVDWALQHGYSYPPEDGQNFPSVTPGNNQGPTINITDPQDGQEITQIPFFVNITAFSSSEISRVDLSIDGTFYQSVNSQPFTFNVAKNLSEGTHTIAAIAIDKSGLSKDTSTSIIVNLSSPLSLNLPSEKSLIQFPSLLSASSNKLFGTVSFYYEDHKGNIGLIGNAENINHLQNEYNYTLNWQHPLVSGNYKIFAKSSEGITSKKTQVSVP